jgi:hypothetical protein
METTIREFVVTDPPTSGEVYEQALDAKRQQSRLKLSTRLVPTDRNPEGEEIVLSVKMWPNRDKPDDIVLTSIIGEDEQYDTVNLTVYADPGEPATLSLVVDVDMPEPALIGEHKSYNQLLATPLEYDDDFNWVFEQDPIPDTEPQWSRGPSEASRRGGRGQREGDPQDVPS